VSPRRAALGVPVLLLAACGGSRNDYGGAVGTAAFGMAGAAVHRVTTKGCYGQCLSGTRCNTETGLCERMPCGGACPGDWVCDATGPAERCVQPKGNESPPECRPTEDGGSLLLVTCSDGGADAAR
jgi:hypothetical protein